MLFADFHTSGPIIYNSYWRNRFIDLYNNLGSVDKTVRVFNREQRISAIAGNLPKFEETYKSSQLALCVKTLGTFGDNCFSLDQVTEDITLEGKLPFTSITRTRHGLVDNLKNKRISLLFRIEDCLPFEKNESATMALIKKYLSIVQLTYNRENNFACGCLDQKDLGIKKKGKKLIKLMEKYSAILDLSHQSTKTSLDLLALYPKPIVCSHAGCDKIFSHPRSISDSVLKELANRKGILGIPLNPNLLCSYKDVEEYFVKHLEHAIKILGENYVCIGSDWGVNIPSRIQYLFNKLNPQGYQSWNVCNPFFSGINNFPSLNTVLLNAGFGTALTKKILGENLVNYFLNNLP